jgi:hypothetical protein
MSNYEHLMDEVRCINAYLKTTGVLDALQYIQQHEDEYEGTLCHREFKRFMAEGRRLFAPVVSH